MYSAMIIDDEKAVHTVLRKVVDWKKFGIAEPLSVRNGKEALALLREKAADILFVDMNMPEMDGSAFLIEASREFPRSKFIVVSGYDDFRYAKAAIQANAIDYILKPIVPAEINSVIQKAVLLLRQDAAPREEEDSTTLFSASELPAVIKQFLDCHLAEDITLDSLGSRFCFTKEYLSKLFKRTYGSGIYEYLLKIRMEKAKELLSGSSLQIQQIAQETGYNDSNYFSKAFKAYTTLSPKEYRQQSAQTL